MAADYAWAIETHALTLDFCLSFVRGIGPDEVISRLGGADPVSILSADVALAASDAVQDRIDESGAAHPSELDYVAVTQAGDWTMIIEPNGFLCTDDAVVQALSAAGEMVSFYFNENTTPRFSWAVDGREVVGFDPGYPQERSGIDPGRLDRALAELGFPVQFDGDAFDGVFRERTLALMERITGVQWDAEFLQRSTFRCAGVGTGAATQPWYAEVREELLAFAADPAEWVDEDIDGWGERGVTDKHVKALGPVGTRLFDEDRELALAIAYAPTELIRRMRTWVWERPFRLAGFLGEAWFAPIRELVRRGEPVPAADVRLVEQRMDPYLRTVLPPWVRDDQNQRNNAARALLVQWDFRGPAEDLCWTFSMAEGAGAGSWPEMFTELRRDFPQLRDVVIPPTPPPPAERDAMRRRRQAGERQEAEWERLDLERTWGGRIPTAPRLLEPDVQMYTLGLVPYDRDLIDQIAEAGPLTQRKMAVWTARYCCTRSGMISHDWVEEAVIALERGAPPPPSFADFDTAFARWHNVSPDTITHSSTVSLGNDEPPRIDPDVIGIHTVVIARHDDPLIAAMSSLSSAVVADDPSTTLATFRTAFDLAHPSP